MSRLTTMSAEALRSVFSPEADSDIFMLLTITVPGDANSPYRLCDGFAPSVVVSGQTNKNASTLVADKSYIIRTVGTTNWTSIGASSNTAGLVFFASGPGTGTGTADEVTSRIQETDTENVYGFRSRGNNYTFLPMNITLPQEEEAQAPRCTITLNDVSQYLVPVIRTLTSPPTVVLELVLAKTPDTVEASFTGFYMTNFTYTADSITAELEMIDFEREPFPAHSFSPKYFPGMF